MNDATTIERAPKAQKKPWLWLRMGLMLLVVGLIAAGLIFFHDFKSGILKQVTAQIRSAVPTVATTTATIQTWQPRVNASGSIRAVNGADLAAEVGGVVDQISFESGQTVAAGTVLVRLRPNDDDAKLAQLQANAELAAVNLARDQRQYAAKGVAESVVDTDAANLKIDRAQVAAQQALMAEKVIRAPFAGRLGVRPVDIGQYIAAGTTVVTLQQLDPMFVDYYVPQQDLGQISVGQKVTVTADGFGDRIFTGTVTALDARVDPNSRMLHVRATVPNADGALLPDMYVNVATDAGPTQQLVTIPQAAVAYNPYGSLVYILTDGKDAAGHDQQTVRQQFVTTGIARGDQVSILKGVKAGDVVVTAGQLKLHNGSAVKIDNSVQPLDNPAPVVRDQ